MRLQDAVIGARPFQVQTTDCVIHDMPSAIELAPSLSHAPLRYVLDDASVRLVSETAFHEKSMVGGAIDLLRVPAETVWVEWHDRSALEAIAKSGALINTAAQMRPRKIGVLIETDASGRRGQASMVWQNDEGEAERSPFVAVFDLDDEAFALSGPDHVLSRYLRISGLETLDPLYRRVRFCMDRDWQKYFLEYSGSQEKFDEVVSRNLSQIAGDLPFVAAFFLMISTRAAFEESPTDLSKLNAKRAKKGRGPLLDHVTVSLNLGERNQRAGGSFGDDRSGPRLHHVSGHLVRRGDALFWRRAHLRGNPQLGLINSKTVQVFARGDAQKAA